MTNARRDERARADTLNETAIVTVDQLAVFHDAHARSGFLRAKQIVRGHQHRDTIVAQALQEI
jgi:hypothetical protein